MLKHLIEQPGVTINPKKAKLHKEGTLELSFDLIETDTHVFVNSFNIHWPFDVDKSLKETFDKLRVHLLLLTETVSAASLGLADAHIDEKDYKSPILEDYRINGITWQGIGDAEGIAISGVKKLKSKKAFNIHAPFTKFVQPIAEKGGYSYADQLREDIENCKAEITAYLCGRYTKTNNELPFGEKKGSKKKVAEGAEVNEQ